MSSLNRKYIFDPRPQQYRDDEQYSHQFRSCILNYSGAEKDMPVKHLYQPANMYAALKDHELGKTSEARYLESAKVKKG